MSGDVGVETLGYARAEWKSARRREAEWTDLDEIRPSEAHRNEAL